MVLCYRKVHTKGDITHNPPPHRPSAHHRSMGVEYSVDPRRTSGGRYHRVTTSLEYVFVGTDLALARPEGERHSCDREASGLLPLIASQLRSTLGPLLGLGKLKNG